MYSENNPEIAVYPLLLLDREATAEFCQLFSHAQFTMHSLPGLYEDSDLNQFIPNAFVLIIA